MKTTSKKKTTSKAKTTLKMKTKPRTLPEKKVEDSLTGTATLPQSRKFYQLFKPEIDFDVMKQMYTALFRKEDFLGKDN